MPSIKDFVEALSASWPVALAALIGSVAVIVAHVLGLEIMSGFPSWGVSAAFVLGAFASAVLIVSVIRSVGNSISRFRTRQSWEHSRRTKAAKLNDLSDDEALIVTWAAANNMQVISAPLFNPAVRSLEAKGLIELVAGAHLSHSASFMFPDYIWDVVQTFPRPQNDEVLLGAPFPVGQFRRLSLDR